MNKKRYTPLSKFFKLNQVVSILVVLSFLMSPLFSLNISKVYASDLLLANFNSNTNGFSYLDDVFGTSQPSYASGSRVTGSSCYGGSGGCLNVLLGGINGNDILGMSGGWSYNLTLNSGDTGVVLSFRYKLDQTAKYEYDEYSRIQVKVDNVMYGRGSKGYIDHLGGDGDSDSGSGGSSAGNSNTFLPTTDWQNYEIFLGDLAAGTHTITLGAYNNKKTDTNESTTATFDDVVISSGNQPSGISDAQTLVNRVDIDQFLAYNQGVAQFDDRCRGSGMGCSSTDYSTNYFNALAWVEQTLQSLGYTTVRQSFNYNGNTGTNLYATKVGTTTPNEMYMLSTHLDGRGGGDAFNDDGSGVALVLEVARVLAGADVTTDKSVRFLFWDKEELGLYGSRGYVQDRRLLQGTAEEPTWLGLITHDMILYDHGVGSAATQQSVYADLDVEWRSGTTQAAASKELAMKWRYLAGTYATDYPANAYDYSTNTDDTAFHPYVASISVRENRRNITSGTNAEWVNPYYHKTTDVETSYLRDDDGDGKRDDVELGFNAVQATLGVVAELAGAHLTNLNQPPAADAQSVTMDEDTSLAITLTGSDPEGSSLSYTIVTAPQHGMLSGIAPALTYTPSLNFNGSDSFSFKVNDGLVDSSPVLVSIAVNPINDEPTAIPQNLGTTVDTPLEITLSGVDSDSDALSFQVTSQPINGTLQGEGSVFIYTPAPGFLGVDSFNFVTIDGQMQSSPAAVTITVTSVNHAPSADPQTLSVDEDSTLTMVLTGSDPDNDPVGFIIQSMPTHGNLEGSAENWVYTPNLDFYGQDGFAFVTNDGQVDSQAAIVQIEVLPVNDAPLANSLVLNMNEDGAIDFTLSGIDVDGDLLNFLITANPLQGVLTGTPPQLTYIPAENYYGSDSLRFVVNDGTIDSPEVVVNIYVQPVNDAPIAYPLNAVTAEDTSVGLSLSGWDLEGAQLTYSIVTNPAHGSLSGTTPNLLYTPAANFNGADSISFRVSDGQDESAPVSVSITVNPVNDPPSANPVVVVTQQNTSVGVILTGSDLDGDSISCKVVTTPVSGTLTGSGCNLVYSPTSSFTGTVIFTYTVNDGQADSAAAQVSVTVNPTGPVTIFSDNFETSLGWTRNANGTDTASSGRWERADPQSTSYSGAKQLGTTASGSYDLVTGPLAGSSYNSYDVDGGVTTMRSPLITLPATGNLELTFKYYLAHRNNSSSSDYLRVKIVGSTTVTILQEYGASNDDDAVWATFTGSLNSFRGQSVYILIEAADLSGESLVEAAIDDVLIIQK